MGILFYKKKQNKPKPNQTNQTNQTNLPSFLWIHIDLCISLSKLQSFWSPISQFINITAFFENLSNNVPCYKQNVCKICPKIVGVEKSWFLFPGGFLLPSPSEFELHQFKHEHIFVLFRFSEEFQGLLSIAVTQHLAVNYLGQLLSAYLEFRLIYPENTCFLSI